jgi:hypothetical protein
MKTFPNCIRLKEAKEAFVEVVLGYQNHWRCSVQ